MRRAIEVYINVSDTELSSIIGEDAGISQTRCTIFVDTIESFWESCGQLHISTSSGEMYIVENIGYSEFKEKIEGVLNG